MSIQTAKSERVESQLFELIDSGKSNVSFNNHIEENFQNFFAIFNYVYNGAGVAVGDINNDGLSDIYFVGNEVSNKLYLNKGDFVFEDITESADVSGGKGWHNGVVMADINGDGWQDIYVCRGGNNDNDKDRTNLLFINQGISAASGKVTFKEQAAEYGLNDNGYSLMASFFDMDNDNDLDMYLTNRPNAFFLGYEQVLQGKEKEDDLFRDKLYLNTNGKFKEVGLESGIKNNFGYGLGIATSDINSDGLTDVMVSNDYLERDYLYVNKGKGKFRDELTQHFNHIPFYSMGIDVVDFNNDGFEDIIQLEMLPEDYERSKTTMAAMNTQLFKDMTTNGFYYQYMHNQLQLNRGNGFFSDIAAYSGVSETDWSWACLGSDFDNDGYRDLFITNGFKRDIWDKDANAKFNHYMQSSQSRGRTNEQKAQYIINLFKENKIPNYIYKNKGDLTFVKKTVEWGMHQESFSNGAATADFDNDGDLDVVVNNIDGEAFVYRNTAEKLNNNHLKIKLVGPPNNRTGLGAKVTIMYNGQLQYHEFKTVRGYLSSVEPTVHFGLGKTQVIDEIKVLWNDGNVSILNNVQANQMVSVMYSEAKRNKEKNTVDQTIFKEITKSAFGNPFMHKDIAYNDFKDQILLPHKLSQNGPAIAVADVNNDGQEDFYVGGAAGQQGMIYLQNSGRFMKKSQSNFKNDAVHEDVAAVFLDVDADEDLDLYVVSGSNEFDEGSLALQDRLYLNDGQGNFNKSNGLPEILQSGSCVVPLDFDSDGDLDLFIGGRLVPKKYPNAPKSFLLENNNGVYSDITKKIAPGLSEVGMVTSAVWSDIDGDASNELIVVGEWMPISIFKKENSVFKNVTAEYGLTETTGWWNQIIANDIDDDGDTDFIVGNLGLNYKFSASVEKPFYVYADDFDGNGTNDIFLAKKYKGRQVPIRGWQCTSEQMPDIGKKFRSYTEFSKADIQQVVGENVEQGVTYKAQEFASVVLINDNGRLIMKRLPIEAQFSTINGIVVDDFNKDGIKDIVIAGNKFEVEIETTRADASIGLVLLGTVSDNYKVLTYIESGFFVPYNVKNLEKIKLNSGRNAILTAINDDEIKLFAEQ
ncbi:VCBS repeat-containing protein [Maribacter sp. 2210JD10-5]|uniref:VCBS repeat-containing protein n=1 Tax=Maribacter sp. 2210JD10-5 TaxID=3386272 RepID=UPI0039BC5239